MPAPISMHFAMQIFEISKLNKQDLETKLVGRDTKAVLTSARKFQDEYGMWLRIAGRIL